MDNPEEQAHKNEIKQKLLHCLKVQYSNPSERLRVEAEDYLRNIYAGGEFWGLFGEVVSDPNIEFQLKSSMIVFAEKMVTVQVRTSTFEMALIDEIYGVLFKILCLENLDLKLKKKTAKMIKEVGDVFVQYAFELENSWEYYVKQYILKYDEVRSAITVSAGGDAGVLRGLVRQLFAVMIFLENFFESINDIGSSDELRFFYDFLEGAGSDVYSLVVEDASCQNELM